MKETNTLHFYKDLKNEVFSYLKENNIPLTDTNKMMRKYFIVLGLFVSSYLVTIINAHNNPVWLIIGAPVIMLTLVFFALGVSHDGSHKAFSSNKSLNKMAEISMNLVGVSNMIWYKKHVMAHHNNTNVHGMDQDTDTGGMIRLHKGDKSVWFQKWQRFYAWPLYALHMIRWLTFDDIIEYKNNTWNFSKSDRKKLLIEIIITKIWHYSVFLIIPFLVTDSIGYTLGFYFIMWSSFGLLVATTFNLAHVTTIQKFYTPGEDEAPKDWAIHQLETTADFACSNKALTWAVGGLNFQVIHHIFPNVSHVNYPVIQKIVKKFCQERGVTYNEYPNVLTALKDHYSHLKVMSPA